MTISLSSALADSALECVLRLAFIVAVAHIEVDASGVEDQFVILQVNYHQFELAEKVHAQQTVSFLSQAFGEGAHVHRHNFVIAPGDGPHLQRGPGENSRTGKAGTLAGGYDVV